MEATQFTILLFGHWGNFVESAVINQEIEVTR